MQYFCKKRTYLGSITGKGFGFILQPGIMFPLFILVSFTLQAQTYTDPKASLDARIKDLLHQMTLEEKISLLGHENPGIPRLHLNPYNWWNEALHGVARAGEATVFPQAIGLAATFNDSLVHEMATVISTEARAKYNLASATGNFSQYLGLTFWSPNINIFRDPRWGRGAETYGEDPFLTAAMGTAFVTGLQGNGQQYLKTAACAKHYAVHSGPESQRHGFNAVVNEKDLRETYLYAFNKLVKAGVSTVMCAYNQINGEPCCTAQSATKKIIRDEWKFSGQLVTDCGALYDILNTHKEMSRSSLAAAAIHAGLNLECGGFLQQEIAKAIHDGLIKESEIDSALVPDLSLRFRLGLMDQPMLNPYAGYNQDSIHNSMHVTLARKLAEESMVMLKNNGILPLERKKFHSIMVVGANASSLDVLLGSYHGINGNMVSFAEGIATEAGADIAVQYDQGYDNKDSLHFGGIWAAGISDLTIAVIGLSPVMEGEEGDAFLSESGGDRLSMKLPNAQLQYLKKLKESTKKPLVVVITGGSSIDLKEVLPYADAILMSWYPGEQGGSALGEIVFGKISPSGHLPITFYQSLDQLPPYTDYSMKGRTYRYFSGPVQFPFGFGLSYANCEYSWEQKLAARLGKQDTIRFSIQLANKSSYELRESVQVYIQYPSVPGMPKKELKAFKKILVPIRTENIAQFAIPVAELKKWNEKLHGWELTKGDYMLTIGKNAMEDILSANFRLE
jgi:beta-glucosidase